MDLDLLHLHELGTRVFGHRVAVAGRTGLVRGDVAFEVGAVLRHHLGVCAEAARGQDDRPGVNRRVLAIKVDLHARHRVAVLHQLLGLAAHLGGDAALFRCGHQAGNEGQAHCRTVRRTMAALDGHAAGQRDVVQLDAQAVKPVDGTGRIVAHELNELGIARVVAAVERFLGEQVVAVLDALLFLELRLRGVHAARREVRVATVHRHLLQDHDVREPLVVRGDGRREAGAARADDHRVVRLTRAFARSRAAGGRVARRRAARQAEAAQHAQSAHRAHARNEAATRQAVGTRRCARRILVMVRHTIVLPLYLTLRPRLSCRSLARAAPKRCPPYSNAS